MGLWRAALGWHGACRSPPRQGLSSARAVQSLQEHSHVPADPQDGEQCARAKITQLRPPSQDTGLPAVHIPVVAGGGGRAAASAGRAGLRPLHRGVWPCRASMLLCAAVIWTTSAQGRMGVRGSWSRALQGSRGRGRQRGKSVRVAAPGPRRIAGRECRGVVEPQKSCWDHSPPQARARAQAQQYGRPSAAPTSEQGSTTPLALSPTPLPRLLAAPWPLPVYPQCP